MGESAEFLGNYSDSSHIRLKSELRRITGNSVRCSRINYTLLQSTEIRLLPKDIAVLDFESAEPTAE